ncbi:MAG: hypothetical protein OXL40_13710 [Bacteroidota bacterium]|nr:hypothetical protein [Bacteroidota bacterium]
MKHSSFLALIGPTLLDYPFAARALAEDLDDAALHHELALGSDKWVYRAMLEELSESGASPEDAVERLRQRYGVVINHAVLDTLDLSPPHHAALTVLKVHTLRHSFSVADPI